MLAADQPDAYAHGQTHDGGTQPAHAQVKEGQRLLGKVDRALQVQLANDRLGQRLEEVKQRGDEGEEGDGSINGAVMLEDAAQQTQQPQCDGQRIQQHQHRQGIIDDRVQAQIGYQEGQNAENDRPYAITRALGE